MNTNENKAVYRSVPAEHMDRQDTLVYDRRDGFAWVRFANSGNKHLGSEWADFFPSAVAAETSAREAGLDPRAVYYIDPLVLQYDID